MRSLPNTNVQWTPKECHLQCLHKRFPGKRRRWFSHAGRSSNNLPRYAYIVTFTSQCHIKLFFFLIISIEYFLNIIICSILTGITTEQVLEQYFQKHSPVYPGVEWRIKYKNGENFENLSNNLGTTHRSVGLTILLITTWLLLLT